MSKTQFIQYWIIIVTICTASSITLWFAMNDIEDENDKEKYKIPALLLLFPLIGTISVTVFSPVITRIFGPDYGIYGGYGNYSNYGSGNAAY